MKSIALLALASIALFSFQNCSGTSFKLADDVAIELASQAVIEPLDEVEMGKSLYTQNCASCHMATTISSKAGRTAAQISAAIAGIPQMNYLTQLSGLQVSYIARALGGVQSPNVLPVTNPFSCVTTEPPQTLDARRLSRVEYVNAVTDLLTRGIGSTSARTVLTSVNLSSRVPEDSGNAFSTGDNNFSVIHTRDYFNLADAIATQVTSPAYYSQFVTTFVNYNRGACANLNASNLSIECRDAFIRNLTLRSWGRPIDATDANLNNEMASMQREFTLATTSVAAVNAVIFKVLMSPQFLMHLQIDVSPMGSHHRLTSYAIARRLAFTFTRSLPDETLLTMAGNQDLYQPAAFLTALDHVSQRMDPMLAQFTSEWLHLDDLPNYNNQNHPKFSLVTQGLTADENLRVAMRNEVTELMQFVSRTNKSFKDLMMTDVSLARQSSLMRIYGQSTPAPVNTTDLNAVRFPAGERAGLMTRAALLFSGGHTENTIMRGVHNRKNLLCLSTAPPPPSLPADSFSEPVANANQTTRERYHNKTAALNCVGCHSQINPIGYALSQYNSFGAFQSIEPVFDADGNFIRNLTTNASTSLSQAFTTPRTVANAIELSDVVSDSQEFKKCMTQNFYTYAHGLADKPVNVVNSCTMSRMFDVINQNGTAQDFFRSSALDNGFRLRRIER